VLKLQPHPRNVSAKGRPGYASSQMHLLAARQQGLQPGKAPLAADQFTEVTRQLTRLHLRAAGVQVDDPHRKQPWLERLLRDQDTQQPRKAASPPQKHPAAALVGARIVLVLCRGKGWRQRRPVTRKL